MHAMLRRHAYSIVLQQQQHCTTKDVLASPACLNAFIHVQQAAAVANQA